MKHLIFYLLCFHILWYKYEAALLVYPLKFKNSCSCKNHQDKVWSSPFKKTLSHFRTHMFSLLSTTSKVHLVEGVMIQCTNLGFATFILKYQQLHCKLKQNSKQVLNFPSPKKFMNSVQAEQSALEGLRFYYQDIRLGRYKAGRESYVGIVETIITCFQSQSGFLESVD